MKQHWPSLLLLLLVVPACGSGPAGKEDRTDPTTSSVAPLSGYAYVPGPAGDADGARFSRFEPGAKLFVGVDDANLRAADDTVVARLRLGSSVTVIAASGEPVEAIGRRNIWYEVRTDTGVQGRLFGGLLTPFGGIGAMVFDGDDTRGWAVTFSPEGRARLRVDTASGSDEAFSLDVAATQRFKGGRVEAGLSSWGDYEVRFEVMQCRLDGGAGPACSSARVALEEDGLVQLTPPDPWQYAPPEGKVLCSKGSTLDVTLAAAPSKPILSLKRPDYMRGGGSFPAQCYELGTAADGRSLISCSLADTGKGGPDTATVERYLRDANGWTHLPCASSQPQSELTELLVEHRIRLTIDATIAAIAGLEAPKTLPVDRGSLTLAWRTGSSSPGLQPLFSSPSVGEVSGSASAIVVSQPDGTELRYQWAPTLDWQGSPPSEQSYVAHTNGCAGYPERLINLEPKLTADDLDTVASLVDGTEVLKLKDPSHPINRRHLRKYGTLQKGSEFAHSPELKLGLSEEELLASNPWLFVQDPWGRFVRLMRKDFEIPATCEPILYTYADPPTELTIAPRPPLRFFATEPAGQNGWQGIAQPDGSILIDGKRWPELFWEGRSVWFRAPEDGVVVDGSDLAAYLKLALAGQGLTPRETTGFLNAWLPSLRAHAPVRIAFHRAETIAAIAPLDITPAPDLFIRVMMDAAPSDASPDWDGAPPVFAERPVREGLVVVEWGGLLRE